MAVWTRSSDWVIGRTLAMVLMAGCASTMFALQSASLGFASEMELTSGPFLPMLKDFVTQEAPVGLLFFIDWLAHAK